MNEFEINNVNHKNFIVMWNFLKGFAKENNLSEEDINIFKNVDTKFDKERYNSITDFFLDPDQWSPLELYVDLYMDLKNTVQDPNAFRNCGRSAAKYKGDKLKDYWRFARSVAGPSSAINFFPRVMGLWNKTKELTVFSNNYNPFLKKVESLLMYKFFPHIDPVSDYCSDPHILGLFEAVPTNWGLPLGEVNQIMDQYDPIKLFNSKFFSHLKLEPIIDGNILLIKDPNSKNYLEIGKKIILKPSKKNNIEGFFGDYEFKDSNQPHPNEAFLITKNLEYKGEKICSEETRMNGPHFLLKYQCDEFIIKRMWYFLRSHTFGRKYLIEQVFDTNEKLRQVIDDLKIENNERKDAYYKLEQANIKLESAYSDLELKNIEIQDAYNQLTNTNIQLEEAKKIQEELNEKLLKIFKTFAHELRSSVGAIILDLETILVNKEHQNYLDNIFKDNDEKNIDDLKKYVVSALKNIIGLKNEGIITQINYDQNFFPIFDNIKYILSSFNTQSEKIKKITSLKNSLINSKAAADDIDNKISKYIKYGSIYKEEPGNNKIDLISFFNSVKNKYNMVLIEKNIEFILEGDEGQYILKADSDHLDQIYNNLIQNAIYASKPEKKSTIKINFENKTINDVNYIKTIIEDNGTGIKKEILDKIFIESFTTKGNAGTGLGLNIAKGLLEKYSGKIYAESEFGKGTKFYVEFPTDYTLTNKNVK